MKAPSFAYAKPRTLAEAFELVERPGAQDLAGGQSLIPALNMRLSAPELLVDITGLASLRGVTLEQGVVRIGALTTHAGIERSAEIPKHVPLRGGGAAHRYPAIRNRGTPRQHRARRPRRGVSRLLGVALEATIVLQSKAGERMVRAEEFFKGLFEVDLAVGELVAAVEIRRSSRTSARCSSSLRGATAIATRSWASRSHEALRTQACLFRLRTNPFL